MSLSLSKYNTIKYIIDTFPGNESDPSVFEKHLNQISRIFGKKHILPDQLVEGLIRTFPDNTNLHEMLREMMLTPQVACRSDLPGWLDRYDAWVARRDAGNKLTHLLDKEKRAKIHDKNIEIDEIRMQSPFYKLMLDIAKHDRDAELANII